jgi:hypothetical protein
MEGMTTGVILLKSISRAGQARRGNPKSIIRRSDYPVFSSQLAFAHMKNDTRGHAFYLQV